MPEREKVIKALECCQMVYECKPYEKCPYSNGYECGDCDINQLHYDALAMLKEQKAQKFFVDESGKIAPIPVIVRCKDCKWLLECENGELQCEIKQGWFPVKPDWFCADGEKKSD